jgi:hypothetical protein
VTVNYSTRIELEPNFRRRFGAIWPRCIALRSLNPTVPPQCILSPYYIASYVRCPDAVVVDPKLRTRIQHTQKLWLRSPSCAQLDSITRTALEMLKTPITQIIGIGLGKVRPKAPWYANSALQHLLLFSLAKVINTRNKTYHPATSAVKIILQDPCYEANDHTLLRSLTSSPLTFPFSDPETLLAVNEQSMLVTAYLPIGVPLMQILGDLFSPSSSTAKGPGIMICDIMKGLDADKQWYCAQNRDAPHVARWLRGYEMWQHKFEGLGRELERDVELNQPYWMEQMDFRVRKDR